MRSILLAVASPGEVDTAVMNKAARLASAFDAELELFHCAFDAAIPRPGRHDFSSVEADVRAIVDTRRKQLEAIAERLGAAKMRVRTSVRWDYPPHEGVSRSLVKRILIGHTAEHLLDALDCDLLIAKPSGFRTPVRRQSAHRIERESGEVRGPIQEKCL